MSFHIIIPSRLQSTRLPEKVLCDIEGCSMLERSFRQAQLACPEKLIIATDHPKIAEHASAFGATVCMTSVEHVSGTSRLAETVEQLNISDQDIVVNLQADEPLMPPDAIQQVVQNLEVHSECAMSTVCLPIHSKQEILDPNIVKVVFDADGHALYFSRAPIPWSETYSDLTAAFRHVGLYAYRAGFIKHYFELPRSPLEELERLEQLRALLAGFKIHVEIACALIPPGIDTVEDLNLIRKMIRQKKVG